MASSRGRERLKERLSSGKSFVFGSSTPRDLSHMNKIPLKLRSYDARVRMKRGEGPQLSEYMEKARSLSREQGDGRHFAFGSSTPRDMAHITALAARMSKYDPLPPPKKSATSPEFATPVKRSTTAPPSQRKPAATQNKQKLMVRAPKDDDISSEPDFVQDREEFLEEMRKLSRDEREKRAVEAGVEALNVLPEPDEKELSIAATGEDQATFAHAAELASEASRTERVAHDVHDEGAETASHQMVHGIEDQMTVSELIEDSHQHAETQGHLGHEIVREEERAQTEEPASDETVKSSTDEKITDIIENTVNIVADVIENAAEKTAKVVDDVIDKIGETGDGLSEKATKGMDEVSHRIEDTVDHANKTVTNGKSMVGGIF